MFKSWFIFLMAVLTLFCSVDANAIKQKQSKKQAVSASAKKKTLQSAKHKKGVSHKKAKSGKRKKPVAAKGRKHSKKHKYYTKKKVESGSRSTISNTATAEVSISAPQQMIAQNKEKIRLTDSVHKSIVISSAKIEDEGYFASLFSNQKKAASIQTLEGTAAVFKSLSGWQDKKFYILTNQLPVGTVVRITTSDFKSICAKVINSLPEVGNAVQYRLNDAAAAILGITNKTFQISVTY
ncbi:MAG: hypothetical protein RL363_745 [Bacteroidota bacterium]|jgi:hypothetical protein